jgi:hypothetical protein
MAVKFEFYLSDEDCDRLFYAKQLDKRDDLTGNEFAKALLENTLRRICRNVPERDENGDYI